MDIALLLITICASMVYFFYRINTNIHMLQLNSYMNKRFWRWITKNKFKAVKPIELAPLLLSIVVSFIFDIRIGYILFAITYLVLFIFTDKQKQKKKLVYTARVKRLYVTVFILTVIILYSGYIYMKMSIFYLLILSFIIFFSFLLVFCGNILISPVEKGIKQFYYRDAYKKLRSMSNLKIIGITGSYGKTSTKHIIEKILSRKFMVLMTPGSYNTTMGVVITVRNHLKPFHEVFIAEMGAKKKGDIKEICDLVHPQYGVLTSIGPQHLETFGSIENVKQTKYELIRSLPNNGVGLLNFDDENVLEAKDRYGKDDIKLITYGINNKEVKVKGSSIQYSDKGTSFIAVFEGEEYAFTTKLLGQHNVYNILAGISLAFELGMKYEDIYVGVKEIQPVEHRLELKKQEDYILIDDAFNANPVGSKMALEVLNIIQGNNKILITPGMIELGDQEYELNKKFGKLAADVCDFIILVGEKQTQHIQAGLKEATYPKEQCYIAKDIYDALGYMRQIKQSGDVVLIENDLPDNYNE